MATTVDTLLVRIEADMQDLRRDLARVADTTEATGNRMGNAMRRVGKAIAALGGAYAFGSFIKSAIQTGAEVEGLRVQLDALLGSAEEGGKAFDQMAEFAGRVPFSLAEIQAGSGSLAAASSNADELGELLQVTGNIAAQFGIPFNEAAANVQRAMSAGIGAADSFRDRGVSAFAGFEAGVTYSAGETVEKLLDNFGTGGKADGAMDAFAKTTAGTVSMFGDAMHRMRANVAESGLNEGFRDLVQAITGVANASGPLAEVIGRTVGGAFSALADAIRFTQEMFDPLIGVMSSFLEVVKTIGVALFAAFGPQLTAILNAVKVAFKVLADNLNLIVTAAVLYKTIRLGKVFLDGAIAAVKYARSIQALALAQKLLNTVTKRALGAFVAIAVLFGSITGLTAELERSIVAVGTEVYKMLPPELQTSFGDFAKELDGVAGSITEAYNAIYGDKGPLSLDVDDPVGEAAAQLKIIQDALAGTGSSGGLDGLQKAIDANISPVHALREQYKILKTAMDAVGDDAGPKLIEAFNNVGEQIKQLDPLYKQISDGANKAFDDMSNSLTDMVMSGKFDMKSLGDMFKQTVRQMIADAIKLQFIKPLVSGIFGGIGGAIGGPVGGFISSIGTSADGGNLNANMPQLVGERGPELIVPKSASTILNNHNTKNALGGGGGVTVVQNLNISTGVSQTVRAEVRSMMPQIAENAKNAVLDGRRRGGTYGRGMA